MIIFHLRKIYFRLVEMRNWVLTVTILCIILCSSLFIHILEPKEFPTVFVGLWWTMTTMTTVGYGDYVPQTVSGQILAMLLYVTGIGLLGVVIGKLLDFFTIMRKKREAGELDFKGRDHILVIGWSQKAEHAIMGIFRRSSKDHVVLIDEFEATPFEREHVVYIKGPPAHDDTLLRANIKQARAVLIFSDESIRNATLADGKTLLIATSVERVHRAVHSTVEIMDRAHMENFNAVNVDSFVVTNEIVSDMAVEKLPL